MRTRAATHRIPALCIRNNNPVSAIELGIVQRPIRALELPSHVERFSVRLARRDADADRVAAL